MIASNIRVPLAVFALLASIGYVAMLRPMEGAIAQRYADADAVRETLDRDLASARRIPALAAEQNRSAATLARYRLHDSRATTVDRFLHAAARVAEREHVSVQSVAGEIAQVRPITARAAEPAPLDELHLDVTVRGPYDDVLRAVRELNAGDVATQIAIASLSNTERRPGSRPLLNATFHITLLREADASAINPAHPV